MSEQNQFPSWDRDKPQESLEAVYQWAVQNARDQIAWYDTKKRSRRWFSQFLRLFSILFASVGALCPLLDATGLAGKVTGAAATPVFGQWGYLLLAISAAIVGFDYYFGNSSGWMRFIVTQISLERSLKEFQLDWVMLKAKHEHSSSHIAIFLQRAKDFTVQTEGTVKQETEAWVAEFQTNISRLEKILKKEEKGPDAPK